MIIAVPKEIVPFETRVAATPDTVKTYSAQGRRIFVETSAGEKAGFADKLYQQAGAQIVSAAQIYTQADIIIKIQAPLAHEISKLKDGQTILADFSQRNPQEFAAKKLSCFALEKIPRISRAQNMDILSSQSNLAGYKAVINAAQIFQKSFPLLMTSAGTLAPAKVMILGLGVAGLQAAATAKRLGALVYASDIREETAEQAASVGAKFLQSDAIAEQLSKTDILITTAQTIGKPAPRLITKNMLQTMPQGAVIIDMATSTGGNVEGSQNNQTISLDSKLIIGNSHLATELAYSASVLFAGNIRAFLELLLKTPTPDFNDEIIKNTCLLCNGKPFRQGE